MKENIKCRDQANRQAGMQEALCLVDDDGVLLRIIIVMEKHIKVYESVDK